MNANFIYIIFILQMYDQKDNLKMTKFIILNPPLWLLVHQFGEEEQLNKLSETLEHNKRLKG